MAENEKKQQSLQNKFEAALNQEKEGLVLVNQRLKTITDEKEKQEEDYAKKVNELNEMLLRKNKEFEELVNNNRSAAIEFETLRRESEAIKASKGEVDASIRKEFDDICEGLRTDLQKAHVEITELKTASDVSRLALERNLVDKEETCQGLTQMVAEQRETINKLTSYVEQSKLEIEPLQDRANDLSKEKEELSVKLKALASTVSALTEERDKLQLELEDTRQHLEGELSKAALEKTQVCQQLRSDFEKTVEEKDEILSSLREKLKEGRLERENLEAQQNENLKEQQRRFEATIQNLKESIDKEQHEKGEMFERLLKDSEKGKEELSKGLHREFENIIAEKEELLRNSSSKVEELQKELETNNKEMQNLKNSVKSAEEETENLKTELDKQSNEKEQALKSMRTEFEELAHNKDKTIEGLRTSLQSVKDELNIALNEKENCLQKLDDELKEKEVVEQKLVQVKEDRDAAFVEWEKELADVQNNLENTLLENKNISAFLEQKTRENESLGSKLNSTIDVNERLKTECSQLCDNINELHMIIQDKLEIAYSETDGLDENAANSVAKALQQYEFIKRSLETVVAEKQISSNKVETLLQNNALLSEKLNILSAEAQEVQQELKSRVAALVREKEDAKLENSYLHEQISDMNSKKAEVEGRLSSELEQTLAQKAETEKQNIMLENEVSNLKNLVGTSRIVEPKIEQSISIMQEAVYEEEKDEKSLCAELELVKSSNEKLKAKLRQLMKRKGKEEKLKSEVENLKDETEALRQEKIDSAKLSQAIRVELDEVVREKDKIVGDLKERLRQVLRDKEQIEAVVLKNEGMLSDRERALNVLNEELISTEDKLKEKTEELLVIQDRLEKTASENEVLRINLDNLQEKLLHSDQKLTATVAEKEQSKDDKHSEMEVQWQELQTVKMKLDTALKTTEQLTSQLNEANKEKEDIKKLRIEFSHIVSGLRADLEHAQKGRLTADQLASEFQMQLRKLQFQLEDGTLDGNQKLPEESEGKDTAVELNSVVKNLQEEIKELKSTNDELKNKVEDLREGNKNVSQLEEAKQILTKENHELGLQIGDLNQELRNTLKSKDELEHILQGLREDIYSALNEKDIKEKTVQALKVEIDRLKKKIPSEGKPVPIVFPLEIKHVSPKSPVEEHVSPKFSQEIFALSHEQPQSFGVEKEDLVKSAKPKDPKAEKGTNTEELLRPGKEATERSTVEESLRNKIDQQAKVNSRLKHMAKGLKADVEKLKEELERSNVDKLEKDQSIKNLRIDMENLVRDKEDMVEGFRQKLVGLANDKGQILEALKSEYEMMILQKDDTIDHLKTELEASQVSFMQMRQSFDSVKDENDKNANVRSELKEKAEQLEAALRNISVDKEQVTIQSNKLEEILKGKTEMCEVLTNRNTDLEDIISDLRKDLEAIIKHRAELEQNIDNLQSDLINVKNEKDALVEIIREKPKQDQYVENAEFDKEITRDREEFCELLAAKLQNCNIQLRELKELSGIQKQEYEEKVTGLLNEIESLSSEKKESERRIQEVRQEMENFVREKDEIVETLRNKLKDAALEHGGLGTALKSEYEQMLVDKEAEVKRLSETAAKNLEEKINLEKLLESLSDERSASAKDKESILLELNNTKGQLQRIFNDKVRLENELKSRTTFPEKVDRELHRQQSECNQSDEQKHLQDLQSNYNDLHAKFNNLVKEYEKLRDALEKSLRDKESVRARMKKDYTRINSSLKQELEEAQKLLIKKEKSLQELRLEIESFVKERESLSALIRKENDKGKGSGKSPAATPEGFGNVLDGMKEETNRLLRELHQARKDNEETFRQFHKANTTIRKDLEKTLSEREAFSHQLDQVELEKKDIQKELREKDSTIVKLKANFEHIGRGWRNDLEQVRMERDAAHQKLQRTEVEALQSTNEDPQVLSAIKERDELAEKCRELERSCSRAEEKFEVYERQLSEMNGRVAALEQQKNILEYDLGNTQNQLQMALERAAAHESAVQSQPQVCCGEWEKE